MTSLTGGGINLTENKNTSFTLIPKQQCVGFGIKGIIQHRKEHLEMEIHLNYYAELTNGFKKITLNIPLSNGQLIFGEKYRLILEGSKIYRCIKSLKYYKKIKGLSMNYNEKEIKVLDYFIEHSIYWGTVVRDKKENISKATGLSIYMVTKIIKKLKEDRLITNSEVIYEDFRTRWGRWRRKPKCTEYRLAKEKIFGILNLDSDYDPQHVPYYIEDFEGLPIVTTVSKSNSTESVYVTYTNTENQNDATVRFSNHLPPSRRRDEYVSNRDEILEELELKAS